MSDYEKLKQIIEDIDNLIAQRVKSSTPSFEAWKTKTERFLIKKYGKDSLEHQKFLKTYFCPLVWSLDDDQDNRDSIEKCRNGLTSCKAIFETYLEDLQDDIASGASAIPTQKNNKVFIVHGHDGELKESVARIIERQDIEAIILSEKANQGRTIIEKFEDYSDVGGAICLFTADDIGREKSKSEGNPRARQNVVFEAGYFMGKLGRNHVVLLADSGVEMPSDLSGVVYTNTANWQFELLKELNAMGYKVDMNKLL